MRERDRRVAIANWHASESVYHQGLIGTLARRVILRERTGHQPPAMNGELPRMIEHEFGLLLERSPQSDIAGRFREAEERSYGLTASRPKIMDDYNRRQSESHAKRADYHAAMARK